jgi:hypothetical protein
MTDKQEKLRKALATLKGVPAWFMLAYEDTVNGFIKKPLDAVLETLGPDSPVSKKLRKIRRHVNVNWEFSEAMDDTLADIERVNRRLRRAVKAPPDDEPPPSFAGNGE